MSLSLLYLQIHQNGQTHEATQAVQTLAEVAATQHEAMGQSVNVELSSEAAAQAVASLAEASMGQDGPQIILTGDASGLAGGDGSQNKCKYISILFAFIT